MREILFRGKSRSLRAGDWIYGYYNGPVGLDGSHEICDINDDACGLMIEVDPETVGQFTGLKDRNGKRIFEGDIVRCESGRICKVVFFTSPQIACFDLLPIAAFDTPVPTLWNLFSASEVIGNIYDNPELMEDALALINQLEARLVEANKTSDDLKAKLVEYEKPLEPLPEEQIYNDPVWLEMRAEDVELMIADIVPSFDEPGSKAEITLLGSARRAHLPYAHYGLSWRCWLRKPTDEERKAAKWDD